MNIDSSCFLHSCIGRRGRAATTKLKALASLSHFINNCISIMLLCSFTLESGPLEVYYKSMFSQIIDRVMHRFPDESKVGRLFYKNYALYSHETAKYYSNSCTLFA